MEPSVQEWLKVDEEQTQKLLDLSGRILDEAIEMRQEIITSQIRSILTHLNKEQTSRFQRMFGFSPDEFATAFRDCNELALEAMLKDSRPTFRNIRRRPSGFQ